MQRVESDIVARLIGELGKLEGSPTELAELLAPLVEHSPVPLTIYDGDQFIVYNNRASCDFGTGNNVVGAHVDSFSPQIREMLKQGLDACQAVGAHCTQEGWINSHVIGVRYLRFDFLPLPSGLTACLLRDSTENKRVEEALKASEEHAAFFAEMLEQALVPFAAAYPDGRLMTVNNAFCELTGYNETELRSLSLFRELTAEQSQGAERQALDQLCSTGRPQRYEKLVVRKDGAAVPVEMFVQQVTGSQGELQRISAFATDISERKRAEEVQQQIRAMLDAVLQHTRIMMVYLDPEFNFIWVNRAYAETCKQDPAFFPGKNHFELYPNEEYQRIFQRVVDTGEPFYTPAKPLTFGTQPEIGLTYWDWNLIAVKDSTQKTTGLVFSMAEATERKLAEQQLAEAHEFSQKIIAASSFGIVVSRASGECVLVNDAAAQVIGATREVILAQNFRRLDSWRNSGLLATAEQALATGYTQSGEFHLFTTFGKDVWWDCKLTPFTSNGEPHLLTVFNDVTERKRAEEALRQSEAFLQAVVSNSPLGVSVRDRTGRLLSYNEAWKRIWLVSDEFIAADMRRERQGLVFAESDEYCKPWWADIKRIFEDGGTLLIPEACTNPGGKGDAVWVSQIFYGILDKQGAVDSVVIVTQDISERRRAEWALRESEERLALALEGAADGVWDHDPVTNVTYRSPHIAMQLGYSPDGLKPTPEAWLELVHPDDLQRVLEAWQAHIEGRTKQYSTEHRLRCANGEYLWVLDSGKVVQSDAEGRPLRVAGTHKNITERKRMEERLLREQKEETLVALARGIAHDFNNILTGILGAASLLAERLPSDDEAHELCGLISISAHRMADLTDKLRAYARGGVFRPHAVSVETAVREALMMTRASIPPHIEVETKLPGNLWAVQADPSQLGQVLLNLLINAREAIGEDSGRISVSAENVSLQASWRDSSGVDLPAGNCVLIRVSDSGCGMDTSTQQRIFEPFFSTKSQGRGLGLAAVTGIVHLHRGAISVESQPGQGCTFNVLLPAAVSSQPKEPDAEQVLPAGTETVLVVDDDEIVLATTRAMLQHLGYTVLAASSCTNALEVFQTQAGQIELAILDLHMPCVSGQNLLELLRQAQPELRTVISSGFSKDYALSEIEQNELTTFIQKPYCLADMAHLVRRMLDAMPESDTLLGHQWAEMRDYRLKPSGYNKPGQA